MRKIHSVRIFAGAVALALTLSAPAGTLTAFADETKQETAISGPSSDPSLINGQGTANGPGASASGTSGNTSAGAGTNYDEIDYSGGIVHPVDKYSYSQMEKELKALAAAYPKTMQLKEIGKSYEGRSLWCAVIGNPNAPKKILFQGAMHAREYMSVPIMMKQAESLLQGAKAGAAYNGTKVSVLLNQVCFYFIPMINPDGVTISQSGEEGATDEVKQILRTAYQQDKANGKTSASYENYLKTWKANARGVDLNNNWDSGNWVGNNGYPRAMGYRGTAPLSEPESKALAELTRQVNFSAAISYHNMGDVIYWDTEINRVRTASKEMADLINASTHYALMNSRGYGGFKDWMQSRSDNPVPGITIEIGKSTAPVNFSEFDTLWKENRVVPGLIAGYVLSH